MKLFCSFAFTGEDPQELDGRMRLVVETLNKNGHDAYCNLYDDYRKSLAGPKAVIDYAVEKLKTCEAVVAIVSSERRSEGLLIEVGVALALNKPVYVFQHRSAAGKSYLPDLAVKSYAWSNTEDLTQALKEI